MQSANQQKLFKRLGRIVKQSKSALQTGRVFHMAFAIQKSCIIAVGYNQYDKTSPSTAHYTKENSADYTAGIHAESDLIGKLKRLEIDPSKVKILVIRADNRNKLVLSKPCSNCAHQLGLHQYKQVWYSVSNEDFELL